MKLKCMFFTVLTLMFLLTGCKDAFIDDEVQNSELKSAELKMLPVSWDLNVILTEFAIVNRRPTPTGGPVEGMISHLGELQEGCFWKATSYIRNDNITPSTVEYEIYGKLIADNGDELFFTTEGLITHVDPATWVGHFDFTGGTGRFKNVVGEAESQGLLTRDSNGIPYSLAMHLEGVLSSVGSSKR